MRHIAVLLAATVAIAMSMSPAGATMRITADRGGLILDYATRFMQARDSGEDVVIDGACLSACTLVVGLLPRNRVCATPRAVLGFHAAWKPTAYGSKTTSVEATQAMLDVYPPELRHWIGRRGGLTPRMIFLRGRALTAFVPSCGTTANIAAATGDDHALASVTTRRTYGAQRTRH